MNNPQCLLDSNFMVALMDGKDIHHRRAHELFDKIKKEKLRVFLSDILINETLSVFAKRCEAQKRQDDFPGLVKKFQTTIRGLPLLCCYELINTKLKQIIDIMVQHQGRFNFHDALFLLILQEVPEVTFVTFDADFKEAAGVKTLP